MLRGSRPCLSGTVALMLGVLVTPGCVGQSVQPCRDLTDARPYSMGWLSQPDARRDTVVRELIRLGESTSPESWAEISASLRREYGHALDTVLVQILVDGEHMGGFLPGKAGTIYLGAGDPTLLERVLDAQDVPLRDKASVFTVLSRMETPQAVAPARARFVCALAEMVVNADSSIAKWLGFEFAQVTDILRMEAAEGSEEARRLVNDPTVARAAATVTRMGYLEN